MVVLFPLKVMVYVAENPVPVSVNGKVRQLPLVPDRPSHWSTSYSNAFDDPRHDRTMVPSLWPMLLTRVGLVMVTVGRMDGL